VPGNGLVPEINFEFVERTVIVVVGRTKNLSAVQERNDGRLMEIDTERSEGEKTRKGERSRPSARPSGDFREKRFKKFNAREAASVSVTLVGDGHFFLPLTEAVLHPENP